MGWFKPETFRVAFEELGYPQFWVDVKKPGSYLLGEADELAETDPEKITTGEVTKIFGTAIVGWNLLDPETDKPLPVPTPKDSKSILRVPNSFLKYLQGVMNKLSEEFSADSVDGIVKKGIEMPPEAISEAFMESRPPSG